MDLDDLPQSYAWFEDGEPVLYDDSLMWNTPDDAYDAMQEYMKENGVVDISDYRLLEVTVTGTMDAEEFMGFTDSSAGEMLEGENRQ